MTPKNKNPCFCRGFKAFFAERTLQSSNLRPLNELENSRLIKAISPYKIEPKKEEPVIDVLICDLTAINDFLFYVESEPFITPEKAKNIKRVPFKKVMAA